MNGYKGKKFTREQLEFIVEVMLTSAVDQVSCVADPCSKCPNDYIETCIAVVSEKVGWDLSILYAQLTDDGMGTGDAMDTCGITEFLENFVRELKDNPSMRIPSCRKMAKKFVKDVFADYE